MTKVPLNGPVWTPDGSTPTPETLSDGQYKDHWILSDEERAKGFVRPVRTKYIHIPNKPTYPLTMLTAEEQKIWEEDGYIAYEKYPGDKKPALGRYWSQAELDRAKKGCGVVTTMPYKIAETYAVKPWFYGSTFCCGCGKYYSVGERGEFYWDDDLYEKVGT